MGQRRQRADRRDGQPLVLQRRSRQGRDRRRGRATQIRTIESYSCFDPFTNAPADALAERIAALTPVPDARVFFAGSGSEAVDSAMKLARLTQTLAGHPERQLIISRERGYHGTNYGGTSAQGLPLNKVGYGELLADVVQVPSDDIEALSRADVAASGRIAAVLTEPVQGAAGVYTPSDGYLESARQLCDQHGALLIFDEVITGFGRLGTWFAAQHYGVVPDLTTFAKAVTSGYQPLGGVIVGRAVVRRARIGRDVLPPSRLHLLRSCVCLRGRPGEPRHHRTRRPRSTRFVASAPASAPGCARSPPMACIDHVRGDGAIFAAGLRTDQDATAVRDRMQDLGVITRAIGTDTLTFCPPLVITDEQIDRVVDAVATALAE